MPFGSPIVAMMMAMIVVVALEENISSLCRIQSPVDSLPECWREVSRCHAALQGTVDVQNGTTSASEGQSVKVHMTSGQPLLTQSTEDEFRRVSHKAQAFQASVEKVIPC